MVDETRRGPGDARRQRYFDAVLTRNMDSLRVLLREDGPAQDQTSAAAAFCRAAHDGNLDQVREFVDAGTSVDVRNNQGVTALMAAAQRGRLEVAEYLLEKGANASARDPAGRSALFFAARSQCIQMATLLVQHGVDPCAIDADGLTAFDVAMQRRFRLKWLGVFGVVRRLRKTPTARYLANLMVEKAAR